MTPRPPADPRIRGYLDALAEAIAEELLRELAETGATDADAAHGGDLGRRRQEQIDDADTLPTRP